MSDGLKNQLNHEMKGKGTHGFDSTPEAQENYEEGYEGILKACGCPLGTKCGGDGKGCKCSEEPEGGLIIKRLGPCWCGSGKRYKHCCGTKDVQYMEGCGHD